MGFNSPKPRSLCKVIDFIRGKPGRTCTLPNFIPGRFGRPGLRGSFIAYPLKRHGLSKSTRCWCEPSTLKPLVHVHILRGRRSARRIQAGESKVERRKRKEGKGKIKVSLILLSIKKPRKAPWAVPLVQRAALSLTQEDWMTNPLKPLSTGPESTMPHHTGWWCCFHPLSTSEHTCRVPCGYLLRPTYTYSTGHWIGSSWGDIERRGTHHQMLSRNINQLASIQWKSMVKNRVRDRWPTLSCSKNKKCIFKLISLIVPYTQFHVKSSISNTLVLT